MSLEGDPLPVPASELLADVQADVLIGGIPKRSQVFLLFNIQSPKDFCQILHLQATLDLFATGSYVQNLRHYIHATRGMGLPMLELSAANISFSAVGLQKMQTALPADSLGLNGKWKAFDEAFFLGMEADASEQDNSLGYRDPMDEWDTKYRGRNIDGLILVAGSDVESVKRALRIIEITFGPSISVVKYEWGAVRVGRNKGHEHFGFNDGVSQPTLEGFGPDNAKWPDGAVGELGDKWNTVPQSTIVVQNANGLKRPKWIKHGTFLVYRKIEQDVEKWREVVSADAENRGIPARMLASKIMGRWPSGCPVMMSSEKDDVTKAFSNQFDFQSVPRANARDALCPIGAHIRNMNPHRAQPHPHYGDLSKDGRMLRRGIPYGSDFDDDPNTNDRGLHFVCYQSRIEYGFKLVQMNWANFDDFAAPGAGIDAITGNLLADQTSRMYIHNDDEGKRGADFVIQGLNPFIKPRGGEYFFTPTLSALRDYLSLAEPKNTSEQQPENTSE